MMMNPYEIEKLKKVRVLVAGDFMLDEYVGGTVQRVSPEAPVPVLAVKWEESKLGGGGNVVNNICALSANARVLTYIGNDAAGNQVELLLNAVQADTRFLFREEQSSTVIKTRIVARNQQVVRVDREVIKSPSDRFLAFVEKNMNSIFEDIDCVILSDYGKGVLSEDLCQQLILQAKERDIPVLVDPKGSVWDKYKGATTCTPNLSELAVAAGHPLEQTQEEEIRLAAQKLCKDTNLEFLLVTRSEKGMSLVENSGEKQDFPAKKQEVIDVSGAGDTVISLMALCLAAGLPKDLCCYIANVGASVVVSKFGTATLSLTELVGAGIFEAGQKEIQRETVGYLANYLREQGKKIVFTNGCFDLVHAGHLSSFEQARQFGDVLIVGVNSDASVRRLKGDLRPIVEQHHRIKLLQALSLVDYVVLFDEDTPEALISEIQPDILVKGQDYKDKLVVGRDIVEARGGSVELINMEKGLSTTNIIEKIYKGFKQ